MLENAGEIRKKRELKGVLFVFWLLDTRIYTAYFPNFGLPVLFFTDYKMFKNVDHRINYDHRCQNWSRYHNLEHR